MLKNYRVVGWVAHEILVSSPVPFWGFWGFEDLRVWGLGLDNSSNVDKRDVELYFLQVSNMSLLSRGQLSKARATAMHQYQGML